jgi:hypothetical protein
VGGDRPVDNFSRFIEWYIFCWPMGSKENPRGAFPSNRVEKKAAELCEEHGWEELRGAMEAAAESNQGWWTVEKRLNGEWDRKASRDERPRKIETPKGVV